MNPILSITTLLVCSLLVVSAHAVAGQKKPPSELGKLLATPILAKDTFHNEIRAFLHARIPELEVPKSPRAWNEQAAALRRRMLDEVVLKGHDPDILNAPTRVEWLDTIETDGGYRIRKLRYEGYPGMWIPALLYEPTHLSGKVPVVLNPNGHERPKGKNADYKQIRCINQAKRGMLALNPEWIAMGELRKPGYDHYDLAYLDVCGQAGVGVFYMLLKRGLDVLLDHPNADPGRTAVTGLSGGGWQTIFLSGLDSRVKVCVPNAGYIGQHTRFEHRSDIGDLEQCPVDQMLVCDYTHMTAMLAPRPALLIYNAKDNCCFVSERAKPSVYDPIVPFYKLYDQAKSFRYHTNTDPGDHNYQLDNRQQLYKFLNTYFLPPKQRRNEEIPCQDEVKTRKQLAVGVPEGNATFYSLAEALAADLPRRPISEALSTAAPESWFADRRAALRACLRIEPATVGGVEAKDITSRTYDTRLLTVEIGRQWHVPVVEIAPKGGEPEGVALVFADGGRAGAEEVVGKLLREGHRVFAADLAFTGQCRPIGLAAWQYEMCVGNVGARPLGLKVTQAIAMLDHLAERHPNHSLTLVGVGRVSSLVAVLATGLQEDTRPQLLLTVGLPASLTLLLEKRAKYTDAPSLFSFGLLAEADVCEMLALTIPTKLKLMDTEGTPEQIDRWLGAYRKLPGAVWE